MIIVNQYPKLGSNLVKFCGEYIEFVVETSEGNCAAFLRTNINQSKKANLEIVQKIENNILPLSNDWSDIPMQQIEPFKFNINIPLMEIGNFEAKVYVRLEDGSITWPEGSNTRIKVEPIITFAGNTIYTAFTRLFGEAKFNGAIQSDDEEYVKKLDQKGYCVLPPSGKFRDLIDQLDFIIGELRCRIIQLLPIHPTPSTYARMGRYGSPFASLNLFDIDSSLAVFDKKTTPMDQFKELVDAIHYRNALIFLDIPINHTGWASTLQNHHPNWFLKNENGEEFKSPGAWGVLWEDLSKLDYEKRDLWIYMANMFLFWCRKGVDGFRCDAGYKIPIPVWAYIIAKVRLEYPNTVFLLEGLGGDPSITEELLGLTGMNWAYSEIFQCYDHKSIENYLPYSIKTSSSKGNLIHFAETHDNNRLAAVSEIFSKLRIGICALTCTNGAFGFSNGVEWFAKEKINVHNAHGLNWGYQNNLISWIKVINTIIQTHPSFFPESTISITSHDNQNKKIFSILRVSKNNDHSLLIFSNLDIENEVNLDDYDKTFKYNLLDSRMNIKTLAPGETICLSNDSYWRKLILNKIKNPFTKLENIEENLIRFKILQIINYFELPKKSFENKEKYINSIFDIFNDNPYEFLLKNINFYNIVKWNDNEDDNRIIMLPLDNILFLQSKYKFSAEIKSQEKTIVHENSFETKNDKHIVIFLPINNIDINLKYSLHLNFLKNRNSVFKQSDIILLSNSNSLSLPCIYRTSQSQKNDQLAICTNNISSLTQLRSAWGEIKSKYDGLLHSNLNEKFPSERHILLNRCRCWVLHNGFSTKLDIGCQTHFGKLKSGEIIWHFNVPVGHGKVVPISIFIRLHKNKNSLEIKFERDLKSSNTVELEDNELIELIVRFDIEDRNSHHISKIDNERKNYWSSKINITKNGFKFTPDKNRILNVIFNDANYFMESEWYHDIQHSEDIERCIDGYSDLYSPGYFKTKLIGGDTKKIFANVNCENQIYKNSNFSDEPIKLEEALKNSIKSFIVKRDDCKSIIAGYPWFLDWGRDSLISLRGIIAADLLDEAEDILIQYASFEEEGTIPNMIRGNDSKNRETSDAPLWFFVACKDFINKKNDDSFIFKKCKERRIIDILESIVSHFIKGTPNGIEMDKETGLIFSPAHFTWMDTNYPACTPREGYPIEIQSLWYFALSFLFKITNNKRWELLSEKVKESIFKFYMIKNDNYFYLADNISAHKGCSPKNGKIDDALRCNQLFAITLGVIDDNKINEQILVSCEKLLIPGAIRSLANQQITHTEEIYHDKALFSSANNPYIGRYSGEEDSKRKPAYHNGTAWTWPFPSYIESLLICYKKEAKSKSMALLNSSFNLFEKRCLGHIPEILDGDSPHEQKGCYAQSWGASEYFRIFEFLKSIN